YPLHRKLLCCAGQQSKVMWARVLAVPCLAVRSNGLTQLIASQAPPSTRAEGLGCVLVSGEGRSTQTDHARRTAKPPRRARAAAKRNYSSGSGKGEMTWMATTAPRPCLFPLAWSTI